MDKRTWLVLLCSALCVAARSTSTAAQVNPFAAALLAKPTPPAAAAADRRDSRAQPRIIEQFMHRNSDGSYEFRYEQSDGNTRYERGYFENIDNVPSLVVTGYYAYRLDDGRYTTVFYTADRGGYRQKAATTSQKWQNLPRTIDATMTMTTKTKAATGAAGALRLASRHDGNANGI